MFDINILISEVNVLQIERVMYGSALNVIANQGHFYFSQMLHSTKGFQNNIKKWKRKLSLFNVVFQTRNIFVYSVTMASIARNYLSHFNKLKNMFFKTSKGISIFIVRKILQCIFATQFIAFALGAFYCKVLRQQSLQSPLGGKHFNFESIAEKHLKWS